MLFALGQPHTSPPFNARNGSQMTNPGAMPPRGRRHPADAYSEIHLQTGTGILIMDCKKSYGSRKRQRQTLGTFGAVASDLVLKERWWSSSRVGKKVVLGRKKRVVEV